MYLRNVLLHFVPQIRYVSDMFDRTDVAKTRFKILAIETKVIQIF